MKTALATLLGVLLALSLVGCTAVPKDPDDTLEHIDATKVIRVGVSHAPPLVDIASPGDPNGTEVDLVREFAASRGATIEWAKGGEEQLIARLEEGHLDLVVGGITKGTPWSSKAAMTRPWGKAMDPLGDEQSYVFLAPLGENALVVALERFFDGREGKK